MSSIISSKYYLVNLVVNYVVIYLDQISFRQFSRQLCCLLSQPNILSSIMSSIISSKYYIVNLVVNNVITYLDQISYQFSRQLCRQLACPNIISLI